MYLPQNKIEGNVVRQELRKLSRRRYVLCNIVQYVRIVYKDGVATEELSYEEAQPVLLITDYWRNKYTKPTYFGRRKHNLSEGKPVQ